jgi:hypothetical protein
MNAKRIVRFPIALAFSLCELPRARAQQQKTERANGTVTQPALTPTRRWVILIVLGCGIAHIAGAQSLGLPCETSLFDGDTRMEYYEDESGNDVEVWCIRGYVRWSQHYELRISYHTKESGGDIAPFDPGRKVVDEHIRTAGGCYLDNGENQGPDIFETPGSPKKKFSHVTWTNTDPATKKEHKFTYNWATNKLTITTTDGTKVSTQTVDPPASYEDLQKLLPDPEIHTCTLTSPAASLGLSALPYKLNVLVRDRLTGLSASQVEVHLVNPSGRWELTIPTGADGAAHYSLGASSLTVNAEIRVFGLKVRSQPVAVSLHGDQKVELEIITFGLPGNSISAVVFAALLLTAALLALWLRRTRRTHP